VRNPKLVLEEMRRNYEARRDEFTGDKMEFHRENLIRFLGRFKQFASAFPTASSDILNHDIFLVARAATDVAKEDLSDTCISDPRFANEFTEYFEAFDGLASGLHAWDEGVDACVLALSGSRS
jgi:hypothetical protein